MFLCPINFISNAPTINLQLHNVSFLLFQSNQFLLGVYQDSHNFAILLYFLQISLDALLPIFISPLLRSLGESLPFRLIPVLIESPSAFFAKMLCPHRRKLSKSPRSFNVPNNTDYDKRRCFQDSDSFNNFFLVIFRTNSVNLAYYMSHTGFKCNKARYVAGLARIIFRKRFYLSMLPFTTLSWQETQ